MTATTSPPAGRYASDWPARVYGRLYLGADRAVTLGALAEKMGTSRRVVERALQELREQGAPVCSDGSGVWLGDRADLDATLASLRRRLVSQYGTFLALRRTRRAMGDYQQTELWVS